jgi:hypothetical protein
MQPRPRIAYVIDPRFPGGTSAAVAAELCALAGLARIEVHAIGSRMFAGRPVAPVLARALADLRLEPIRDRDTISADLILIHNPAFLKFESELRSRLIARHLVVVTHENFLRPGGSEGFAAGHCLALIDAASLALRKSLAPVSPWNRKTVQDWLAARPKGGAWRVHEQDWFNICDFPLTPPNPAPRDRRGRLSRPGFEKFPALAQMDLCFPPHAEANIILGGDTYLAMAQERPHWSILPFLSRAADEFFRMIDFMVYFTSPAWRESFGRVLAEAIAAGKLVICDHDSAACFPGAVIAARPVEVDAIIARFVADPEGYRRHVEGAQHMLERYSPDAFRPLVQALLGGPLRGAA